MTYKINQKFYNTYEPEVAIFCNKNGYVLKEIEDEDSKRVFQIQKIIKNLDELKQEKLQELKTKRDEFKISNNYDNERIVTNILIGLGNYNETERLNCKNFFNNLISKYDIFKDKILKSKIFEDLEKIIIKFEE